MNHSPDPSSVGETVFAFDKRVRALVLPYRHSAPAKAIDWVSKVGDQAQMRVVAGGVIAVGLLRRDPRMIGAGIRMLAAHEVATLAKDWVKERVVRTRPRNPVPGDAHKPREGHDTRKEKSSFPSGHATGAFASATAFAAVYPQHALAAEAAAAGVAAGRIPGCKHYPSDVAAGAAIGIGSAVLVGALGRAAAWIVAGRTAGR